MSSHWLADIGHHVMTLEAMGWFGWPVSQLVSQA
jgi:hypothetical protein